MRLPYLLYNLHMPSLEGSELSERELEILRLVATGLSNKEIAQKLVISPNTVKVHLRKVFAKIGVLSRTEAALYAVHNGLVPRENILRIAEAAQEERPLTPEIADFPPGANPPEASPSSPLPPAAEPAPAARKVRPWLAAALLVLLLAASAFVFRLLSPGSPQTPVPASTNPAAALTGEASAAAPASLNPPRWQTLPPMTTPRSGLALAAFDGRLYAIGGETDTGLTGAVEIFDPASQTWTAGLAMPVPAADLQAAALGGKIYLPGGRLADGKASAQMAVYDPLLNTWERGADLPYPVSAYALAAFEGRLYLFGGWDGEKVLSNVLVFDPALGAWSERTPLPAGRSFCLALPAGGKIYVLGGYDGAQALATVDAYNPSLEGSGTPPWSNSVALPEPRYQMGGAAIADTLLVVGGKSSPAAASEASASYQYFPSGGNWITIEQPGAQPWAELAAAPLEQLIFAIGGRVAGQLTAQSLSYQAIYTILVPIVR